MFTLEINGKPIAVTDADEEEARELLGGEDFKEDMKSLESEGRPLWDGSAPLNVRNSSEEEIEAFTRALEEDEEGEEDGAETNRDDEDGEDEPLANVVFLVSIDEDMDEESASDTSRGEVQH